MAKSIPSISCGVSPRQSGDLAATEADPQLRAALLLDNAREFRVEAAVAVARGRADAEHLIAAIRAHVVALARDALLGENLFAFRTLRQSQVAAPAGVLAAVGEAETGLGATPGRAVEEGEVRGVEVLGHRIDGTQVTRGHAEVTARRVARIETPAGQAEGLPLAVHDGLRGGRCLCAAIGLFVAGAASVRQCLCAGGVDLHATPIAQCLTVGFFLCVPARTVVGRSRSANNPGTPIRR